MAPVVVTLGSQVRQIRVSWSVILLGVIRVIGTEARKYAFSAWMDTQWAVIEVVLSVVVTSPS